MYFSFLGKHTITCHLFSLNFTAELVSGCRTQKKWFGFVPRSASLPACLCILWVTDHVVVLCGIVACFSLEGKDIWSLSADTKHHLKRSGRGRLQMHIFTTRTGGRGAEITKSYILQSALNDRTHMFSSFSSASIHCATFRLTRPYRIKNTCQWCLLFVRLTGEILCLLCYWMEVRK